MVRLLQWLLAVTALATVVIEVLIWWYAESSDWGLAVRTGWALLRSLGFLLLIRQVSLGRTSARPFGLILCVTTLFAVARLVVPKHGLPAAPGVLGFGALALLCTAVMVLLYRSDRLDGHLRTHPRRLVLDGNGLSLQNVPPKRPPVSGWLLTARVAGLAYGPLMAVPAIVALGVVFHGRVSAIPLVVFWFIAAFGMSYVMALVTFFLLRGKRWPRVLLVLLTLVALAVQLPLCWLLLDGDGLVRDGAPLVVTAGLAVYALWRADVPTSNMRV
ncbi:MAG: hypothetical protein HOU81_23140 [Hamadaea sp.]|uniref:hypothetical protein n=1 Tax=Hamadaea sp. TaxID=2024425 RepID=UPI0017C52E44|nr:hypothetical protein [Hamadaea sp.]NUR73721.1 hypothetical protein [Hamadaea sp.]NUT19592.1 hypothetical protein [Hamadaea sp.]